MLGIDVVTDYNKNQMAEEGESSKIQCMMDIYSLLNWEEDGRIFYRELRSAKVQHPKRHSSLINKAS